MTRHRWLYVWLMPLLWIPCAVLSALHPGDKGLAHLFATFPGEWLRHALDLHFGFPARAARIAGALLVVAALGAFMDLMGVSRKLFSRLLCASLVLGAALMLRAWCFELDSLSLLLCWTVYFIEALSIVVQFGIIGFEKVGRTR